MILYDFLFGWARNAESDSDFIWQSKKINMYLSFILALNSALSILAPLFQLIEQSVREYITGSLICGVSTLFFIYNRKLLQRRSYNHYLVLGYYTFLTAIFPLPFWHFPRRILAYTLFSTAINILAASTSQPSPRWLIGLPMLLQLGLSTVISVAVVHNPQELDLFSNSSKFEVLVSDDDAESSTFISLLGSLIWAIIAAYWIWRRMNLLIEAQRKQQAMAEATHKINQAIASYDTEEAQSLLDELLTLREGDNSSSSSSDEGLPMDEDLHKALSQIVENLNKYKQFLPAGLMGANRVSVAASRQKSRRHLRKKDLGESSSGADNENGLASASRSIVDEDDDDSSVGFGENLRQGKRIRSRGRPGSSGWSYGDDDDSADLSSTDATNHNHLRVLGGNMASGRTGMPQDDAFDPSESESNVGVTNPSIVEMMSIDGSDLSFTQVDEAPDVCEDGEKNAAPPRKSPTSALVLGNPLEIGTTKKVGPTAPALDFPVPVDSGIEEPTPKGSSTKPHSLPSSAPNNREMESPSDGGKGVAIVTVLATSATTVVHPMIDDTDDSRNVSEIDAGLNGFQRLEGDHLSSDRTATEQSGGAGSSSQNTLDSLQKTTNQFTQSSDKCIYGMVHFHNVTSGRSSGNAERQSHEAAYLAETYLQNIATLAALCNEYGATIQCILGPQALLAWGQDTSSGSRDYPDLVGRFACALRKAFVVAAERLPLSQRAEQAELSKDPMDLVNARCGVSAAFGRGSALYGAVGDEENKSFCILGPFSDSLLGFSEPSSLQLMLEGAKLHNAIVISSSIADNLYGGFHFRGIDAVKWSDDSSGHLQDHSDQVSTVGSSPQENTSTMNLSSNALRSFSSVSGGGVRTNGSHLHHDSLPPLKLFEIIESTKYLMMQAESSEEWMYILKKNEDFCEAMNRALDKYCLGHYDDAAECLAGLPPQQQRDRKLVLLEKHAAQCRASTVDDSTAAVGEPGDASPNSSIKQWIYCCSIGFKK